MYGKKIFLQFSLLMWKNFLLQFRRPIGTIFEILVPIFGVLVLVVLRFSLSTSDSKCFSTFDGTSLQFDPSPLGPTISTSLSNITNCNFTYFYTPNSTEIDSIVNRTKQILSIPNLSIDYVATASEEEMERMSLDIFNSINTSDPSTNPYLCHNVLRGFGIYRPIVAGLVFDRIQDEIEVTIRLNQVRPDRSLNWRTDQIEPTFSIAGPRTSANYIREGFLTLQDALVQSIIASKIPNQTNSPALLPIDVRQFPYPKYTTDFFLLSLSILLPLLLVFSFIYTAGTVTKEIVLEKQARLRESMKMMGLSNWVNWLAWFTKQLIFMTLVIIILTVLLRFCRIFSLTNILITFIWLFLYVIYLITLSFLVSTFFTSARLALLVSFLVWFMTYFPYFFIFSNYNELPLYSKILACLLGNTCMAMSTNIFVSHEIDGTGITWSNIGSSTSSTDAFNLLHVFAMFILISIVQCVLTWYLDEALPRKYGLRKPFYFPFTPSYWCGRSFNFCGNARVTATAKVPGLLDAFEAEPVDADVGIRIQNLTKKYTRRKIALNALSLNMHRGQITALLGHNGAGKSTLISLLTGLFPPTNGTAYIEDMDILRDMDNIRSHLGICPQSNILFDRLTVKEHLHFFIRLKGVWGWKQAKTQVSEMLNDMKLEDKVNTLSHQLSGGMKRRLSVGLALIGDTKVIILDEPTSGVDPYARRTTWDLLLKYKENRTMLLTTHHMDEADILGDRIAILSEGVLKACGSSLFLKNRFGIGYHLTMVKSPTFDLLQVQHQINSFVTNAHVEDDIGTEISFIIPSQDTSKFPSLFEYLESNSDRLGITSYGISHTTMEDVFRTINDMSDEQVEPGVCSSESGSVDNIELSPLRKISRIPRAKLTSPQGARVAKSVINSDEINHQQPEAPDSSAQLTLNHGVVLWFQQLWAMVIKKAWYSLRRYGFIILQVILPLLFTTLGLAMVKFLNQPSSPDPNIRLTVPNAFPHPSIVSLFHMEVPGNINSLPNNFTLNYISNFSSIASFAMEQEILPEYLALINSTRNNTQPVQCCEYEFQMLDQYCAHRITQNFKSVDFCNANPNFGYRFCDNCTKCVQADKDRTCPRPPPITYNTNQPRPFAGPYETELNIKTVYINEYLLREMNKNVRAFYANYLLGITTNKLDPNKLAGKCLCCSELITNGNFLNETTGVCGIEQQSMRECVNTGIGKLFPQALPQPDRVTLWYNNQGYHMAPAALGVLHNYQFYNLWKENGIIGAPPKITVNNHPLPRNSATQVLVTSVDSLVIVLSVFLTFGLSFLSGSFIIFPIQEKRSRSKLLQFVSGLDPFAYWIGIALWDLVVTFFVCTLVFLPFPCFNISAFSGNNLVIVYLLLLSYGLGSFPIIYFISFLFKSSIIAFSITILLLFLSYQVLNTIVAVLSFTGNMDFADILDYIFSIFPNYSLATGIFLLYNNTNLLELCQTEPLTLETCQDLGFKISENLFTFEKPGVLVYIIVPLAVGIIFFFLTLFTEFLKLDAKILDLFCHRKRRYESFTDEDNDVADERTRISDSDVNGEAVYLQNISKTYPGNVFRRRKPKLAVNQICLGISYGDCFGLLGVNGAGKTTTFEMLAGNLRCSSGTAFIGGFDIRKNLRKVRQMVGYCPQFDALHTFMTGKQLLSMYARIRGVPNKRIENLVSVELDRMGLSKYANQQCGQYSGGNKRKLSAACALIGNAPILLLDEPTTGMDPGARRFFWEVLLALTKSGRCIVLSSHSMEECEALCTRLAIMVNGEFKCLGSTQHLKNKFGEGYTLSLRFNRGMDSMANITMINDIKEFVTNTFEGAELTEEHNVVLEYSLPSRNLKTSHIFRVIEANKERFNILDYGVSQTTLDQLFVNFAKAQVTEDSK